MAESMDEQGFPLQNPRQKMKLPTDTPFVNSDVFAPYALPLPPNKDARGQLKSMCAGCRILMVDFTVQSRRTAGSILLAICLDSTARTDDGDSGAEHHTVLAVTDGLLVNVEESRRTL